MIYFWQLFTSSLLLFFAFMLICEGLFYIFGLKSLRLRSSFRLIALLSLPFSLFLNISCMTCMEGILLIRISAYGLMISSFLSLGYKILQTIRSGTYLYQTIQSATVCSREVANEKLQHCLQRYKVSILITDRVSTPCTAGFRTILFPAKFAETLSQEEFDAVIAHEFEHLCWYDPLLKCVCSLMGAFFWWIPSNWWMQKIDQEIEMACDASVDKYGMERSSLATVIYKVMMTLKNGEEKLLAISSNFGTKKNTLLERLQSLLKQTEVTERFDLSRLLAIAPCSLTYLTYLIC